MAEWDASKIAKLLKAYKPSSTSGSQNETQVTTEDIRNAIKALGQQETKPNEKTFVDFDDGAVPMPSDAELQKIMEKLEKQGIKPEISISYTDKETGAKPEILISYHNQENGDKVTTMATNEEGGSGNEPPEIKQPLTLALGEGGDAHITTMATNEEGGSGNEPPEIKQPLTLALGEGGDAHITTMATNEEGGSGNEPPEIKQPLTLALGEGGEPINLPDQIEEPLTMALGEGGESKWTTMALGEEGGNGNEPPGTFTKALGEGGEPINLPDQIEEPLTIALGEGGESKWTTMALGEEGGDNTGINQDIMDKIREKIEEWGKVENQPTPNEVKLTPEAKAKLDKILEEIKNENIKQYPSLETTKAMGEEGGDNTGINQDIMDKIREKIEEWSKKETQPTQNEIKLTPEEKEKLEKIIKESVGPDDLYITTKTMGEEGGETNMSQDEIKNILKNFKRGYQ